VVSRPVGYGGNPHGTGEDDEQQTKTPHPRLGSEVLEREGFIRSKADPRRMVSSLVNGYAELAATIAAGLGIPVPPAMPKVLAHPAKPEVARSGALALTALPGDGGIRSRRVAILVADGVDGTSLATVKAALHAAEAMVHLIAPHLGPVTPANGGPFDATGTLENSAPLLFDGLILPDGAGGVKTLGGHIEVIDFISNQFRHGKTLLAIGASQALLERAGASPSLENGEPDPGILIGSAAKAEHAAANFIAAMGRQRLMQKLPSATGPTAPRADSLSSRPGPALRLGLPRPRRRNRRRRRHRKGPHCPRWRQPRDLRSPLGLLSAMT
jgi:putative intracellular protease/amidase